MRSSIREALGQCRARNSLPHIARSRFGRSITGGMVAAVKTWSTTSSTSVTMRGQRVSTIGPDDCSLPSSGTSRRWNGWSGFRPFRWYDGDGFVGQLEHVECGAADCSAVTAERRPCSEHGCVDTGFCYGGEEALAEGAFEHAQVYSGLRSEPLRRLGRSVPYVHGLDGVTGQLAEAQRRGQDRCGAGACVEGGEYGLHRVLRFRRR